MFMEERKKNEEKIGSKCGGHIYHAELEKEFKRNVSSIIIFCFGFIFLGYSMIFSIDPLFGKKMLDLNFDEKGKITKSLLEFN